jgi:hypothetical protein
VLSAWQFPTFTWQTATLSSALSGFTSEFGMGSGGSRSLWSPSNSVLKAGSRLKAQGSRLKAQGSIRLSPLCCLCPAFFGFNLERFRLFIFQPAPSRLSSFAGLWTGCLPCAFDLLHGNLYVRLSLSVAQVRSVRPAVFQRLHCHHAAVPSLLNPKLIGCYRVKPHGQLVHVSCTHYCASTPCLSTS